jgi:hypothetical protein
VGFAAHAVSQAVMLGEAAAARQNLRWHPDTIDSPAASFYRRAQSRSPAAISLWRHNARFHHRCSEHRGERPLLACEAGN